MKRCHRKSERIHPRLRCPIQSASPDLSYLIGSRSHKLYSQVIIFRPQFPLPTNVIMKVSSESLTPQRKHRKLLKSGQGEVWSEEVEKVFVQGTSLPFFTPLSPLTLSSGLKKYWESPSATYSRGRSRYRNQFLVDFLQKAGIERSKKQVASHVQVLRNMWKGEKGPPPFLFLSFRHLRSPAAQNINGSPVVKSSFSRPVYWRPSRKKTLPTLAFSLLQILTT